MYSYAEIGSNDEIKAILNLPRRPRPEEIKMIDGKPALRPIETGNYPASNMTTLYVISDGTLTVEPTRVVRNFKITLKDNYKDLIKDRIIAIATSARFNMASGNELSGTGLQVKMMMDEEAEELLLTPEDDRTPEKFPFIFSVIGSIANDPEEVANHFRKEFAEIKKQFAMIEGEKYRLLKAVERAETPDAAMRAFDSRMELFKNY